MSMFDSYRPKGEHRCPGCGSRLVEWQGKEGPCALLVFEEGRRDPVEHRTEDSELRWSDEEMELISLPERFLIYSYDCPTHQPIKAECVCEGGVWVSTKVLDIE